MSEPVVIVLSQIDLSRVTIAEELSGACLLSFIGGGEPHHSVYLTAEHRTALAAALTPTPTNHAATGDVAAELREIADAIKEGALGRFGPRPACLWDWYDTLNALAARLSGGPNVAADLAQIADDLAGLPTLDPKGLSGAVADIRRIAARLGGGEGKE